MTRFAPSPTGYLHIGGARTALFNWLYARHSGGKFLLRIEDTDRARSTPEATAAIFEGLRWLGLDWDGEAISQFERAPRHAEVAHAMIDARHRLPLLRDRRGDRGLPRAGEGRGPPAPLPLAVARRRSRDLARRARTSCACGRRATGETVVDDVVQGAVTWKNETLDDLILLRSDGTPTYMLAVVVDDHDMGVTHVIRGDDHLTNAARQTLIYRAMDWEVPVMAHIPLIHGADGKKLSKRHGALGVEAYRDMGFLPEAMRNYLARLGWSHADAEFFTTEQAVSWFDLSHLGKAPARFDFAKLENLSGQHIRAADDAALLAEIEGFLASQKKPPLTDEQRQKMLRAMPGVKERAKTIPQMLDMARFILDDAPLRAGCRRATGSSLRSPRGMLDRLTSRLQNASWTTNGLEAAVRDFAEAEGLALGKVAQPIRIALTGRTISPGVFDMMDILGPEETLARLGDCARLAPTAS